MDFLNSLGTGIGGSAPSTIRLSPGLICKLPPSSDVLSLFRYINSSSEIIYSSQILSTVSSFFAI